MAYVALGVGLAVMAALGYAAWLVVEHVEVRFALPVGGPAIATVLIGCALVGGSVALPLTVGEAAALPLHRTAVGHGLWLYGVAYVVLVVAALAAAVARRAPAWTVVAAAALGIPGLAAVLTFSDALDVYPYALGGGLYLADGPVRAQPGPAVYVAALGIALSNLGALRIGAPALVRRR